MKNFIKSAIVVGVISLTSCARIETGEVGVRVGFDKTVKLDELVPGSFNQTLVGSVLKFPVKDVSAEISGMTPLAKDNSTMADVDLVVVYSINPKSAAEIFSTKSRGFHHETNNEIYLMYNYVITAARNAVYKSARAYDALQMNDNRSEIESQVLAEIRSSLKSEKLDEQITVQQVLFKNIQPAAIVVTSANELVKAKNELAKKQVEVQTAEQEALRISTLNANSGAIDYMSAMAMMNISEGIKEGKVSTIVVPVDFRGMVNVK